MLSVLKRYLIAGLLVWLPLGVTIAALIFLINLFDKSLLLLPEHWRPEYWLGFKIPGFGIIVSLTLILVTGMLVANFLGNRLMRLWENFLERIPLVRGIYSAVKQLTEAVLGTGDQSFQKVFLLEYPRRGLWTLGFQTSTTRGEAQCKSGMEDVVNLFVPTTPNPTSGFFIMADRKDIIELEMGVDEALKMVISGGVVVPPVACEQQNQQQEEEGSAPSSANAEHKKSENP